MKAIKAKDIMVEMTTPAGTIEEPHPSSDEEEEEYELGFDEMEASLLNEDYSLNKGAMSASNANLGKRINLVSKTVENDINRSEKKGDKRSSHQGRDDRATSEQVMDPRTRMILFKLLANKYLSMIDGKAQLKYKVYYYSLFLFL